MLTKCRKTDAIWNRRVVNMNYHGRDSQCETKRYVGSGLQLCSLTRWRFVFTKPDLLFIDERHSLVVVKAHSRLHVALVGHFWHSGQTLLLILGSKAVHQIALQSWSWDIVHSHAPVSKGHWAALLWQIDEWAVIFHQKRCWVCKVEIWVGRSGLLVLKVSILVD